MVYMVGYYMELYIDFVCEEYGDISLGICFLVMFKFWSMILDILEVIFGFK